MGVTQPPTNGPSLTNLYQIRDQVAKSVVGPIIAAKHAAIAVRMFHDTLASEGNSLNQHPHDYVLMHLAVQDEDSGEIHSMAPEIVATGTAWKETQVPRTPSPLPVR